MPANKRTTAQIKKDLLKALEKSLGVVTQACKMANIARIQYYKYYNGDEKFRAKADEIIEIALDFVETQLYKQIQEGNMTGIIFYLKTKGRNRGYIEQKDYSITQNVKSIEFIFDEDDVMDVDVIEEKEIKKIDENKSNKKS